MPESQPGALTTWPHPPIIYIIHCFKAFDNIFSLLFSFTGVEGFEPANGGVKVRCLTTWRYPITYINLLYSNLFCQLKI